MPEANNLPLFHYIYLITLFTAVQSTCIGGKEANATDESVHIIHVIDKQITKKKEKTQIPIILNMLNIRLDNNCYWTTSLYMHVNFYF